MKQSIQRHSVQIGDTEQTTTSKGKSLPAVKPIYDEPISAENHEYMASKVSQPPHAIRPFTPDLSGSSSLAPVQRKVSVGGKPAPDIYQVLAGEEDLAVFLHEEAGEVAAVMQKAGNYEFNKPDDLFLYLTKVTAMVKLLRSVYRNGILSRTIMQRSEIDYTGSIDKGGVGDLAVNVLDNRAKEKTSQEVTQDSLTMEDNGSFSVAMEREEDFLKDDLAKADDMTLQPEDFHGIPEDLHAAMGSHLKKEKALNVNSAMLNGFANQEMSARAMDTVMAIIHNPSDRVATRSPDSLAYESSVPEGRIDAGTENGFKQMLIPDWFRPFYSLVEAMTPKGIEVTFVGSTRVTAFYKHAGTQVPVTVDAPDYASHVAESLEQFNQIATHILKAG